VRLILGPSPSEKETSASKLESIRVLVPLSEGEGVRGEANFFTTPPPPKKRKKRKTDDE
jgi:hypothetical protein